MAGTLAGTVIDIRNNQGIGQASVVAQPGDHTTTSNDEGRYSMAVPGGTYSMTVSASGYDPFIAEGIFVMDDVTTTINVAMRPPMD